MSDVQVRAAVKAQKAAADYKKLTYRGVAYLMKTSHLLGLLYESLCDLAAPGGGLVTPFPYLVSNDCSRTTVSAEFLGLVSFVGDVH